MSGSAKQIAVSRDYKQRFHRRRARLWKILLISANGLFALTLLYATTPFVIFAIFVDEVFINNDKHSHIGQLLTQTSTSLFLVPAIISFGWWAIVNIREIRNTHVRLAVGYAQSSAEEMLAKARNDGHKFGLFLRGFEAEIASTTYYGPNPEIGSREAEIYARHVEALLIEMLNEEVTLLALADPRDPEPMAGVYRFERIPENWQQFICELLPDAFPIVMHLTSFTPGIKVELDLISSSPYSSKAVIIVSRSLAIRNSLDGETVLKFLSGFSHIVFEQIDKDWSQEQEMEFHARLQESLKALERDSQGTQIIMRKRKGDFTVVTPNRLHSMINFMKGPALVVFILITMPMVIGLSIKGFNIDKLWLHIGNIIVVWLVGIIVLSALKGLTYILGFAQSSGDNESFPTFSMIMKWAKKHSATPK
jgi:hypothetical protein